MNKKNILVTGANRGIGFEVVRQLAKLGHTVVLASRYEESGNAALLKLKKENLDAHRMPLDVTVEEDIIRAAKQIRSRLSSLDVLINNAAVLLKDDRSLSRGSVEVFDQTIKTNVFGPLNVVKHFLNLIPPGGRIIMTSSGGGSMTDPIGGWAPAYCVSKSALNAATRHLAHELSGKAISVYAFCPGWVRTEMGGRSATRSVERGAETAVWLATTPQDIPTGTFFRDKRDLPW